MNDEKLNKNTLKENTIEVPVHAPNNVSKLSLLAYIGPLVLLSYWFRKNNEFIIFHMKQGFIIFGIEVLLFIFSSILMFGNYLFDGLYILCIIYSAIGIWNVVHKNPKEIPLVGGFAVIFTF